MGDSIHGSLFSFSSFTYIRLTALSVSGNATCGYSGHSTTDQPFDFA